MNRTTTHVILAIGALLSIARTSLSAQGIPAPGDARTSVASTAPVVDPNQYLIGADDVLQVSTLDAAEFSGQYRVGGDGKVTLPVLTQPVTAAGLTLAQFSDSLAQDLKAAGLVVDPHVSTSVVQSRLHSVSIAGAVKTPQIYPVFSQTTLLDVLSQAQGLEDDAGSIAIVRRGEIAMSALQADNHAALTPEQSEAQRTVSIDLKKLLRGKIHDVAVADEDILYIPSSAIKSVLSASALVTTAASVAIYRAPF